MTVRPSRRRFLQAAGLTAGGLFLPSLLDRGRRTAAAGPTDAPMRLVIVYTQHGVPHAHWDMHRGHPADTRWEYDLAPLADTEWSDCLRPLHRHRNKVTIVDGLSLATAIADPYGDSHAKGWVSSLTGGVARQAFEGVKSNAAHPSLDQLIGDHARAQDPSLTDLVTLEYGINESNFHAALYADPRTGGPVLRLPHEEQPLAAFRRLFPYGDGATPPAPVTLAQPDLLAEVAAEYDAVAARLGTDDRRKLSLHRALVHDLEARLRTLRTLTCDVPTIVDHAPGTVATPERYVAHKDSFWDLAAVALSCRLSRVVTLQFGALPTSMIGGTGFLHSDYAHPSSPDQQNQPRFAEATRGMVAYTATYAGYVAELADRLDQIPEGNGTLLDHTIILWVSELAHGGHSLDGWPVVMVGGGQRLRTGRYLHVEHDTPTTAIASWIPATDRIGLPHNHLLVSIAQALGVPTDTVGDASVRPKHPDAPPIDLRGPLPGLV